MANPAYLALVGHRPVVGRTLAQALPDAVRAGLPRALGPGLPYRTTIRRVRLRGYAFQESPGSPAEGHYVDFVYQPITGSDGAVSGILVQGVDVTARAMTDQGPRVEPGATGLCDPPFRRRLLVLRPAVSIELEWDDRVKEHFFFEPTERITIDDFYARIHEDDRLATREAIESVDPREDAPTTSSTARCIRTTGEVKWIRALGGTDYASDGTPTHFDGVTVDVSAHRARPAATWRA